MPKSIVPSPTAAVAVDRLTLQATDARATDYSASIAMANACSFPCINCFSEE
jgi:hypothetical protein